MASASTGWIRHVVWGGCLLMSTAACGSRTAFASRQLGATVAGDDNSESQSGSDNPSGNDHPAAGGGTGVKGAKGSDAQTNGSGQTTGTLGTTSGATSGGGSHADATSTDPVPIDCENSKGVRAQAIALGEYHACALTTAGGVRCWGNNRHGQRRRSLLGHLAVQFGRSFGYDSMQHPSEQRRIHRGQGHSRAGLSHLRATDEWRCPLLGFQFRIWPTR